MGSFSLPMEGKTFNLLTVTRRGPDTPDGKRRWYCDCACGTKDVLASGTDLRKKRYPTDSCGCLKKKRISEKAKGRKSTRLVALEGKTFYMLTVTKRGPNTEGGQAQWYCDCVCGEKDVLVRGSLLRSKKRPTQSCGCHQKRIVAEARFVDLTNQRFGRLLVLKLSGQNRFGQYLYKCQCDCGEVATVIGARLTAPDTYGTRSCGCLMKERASEANKVDLTGKTFGRLTCIRPLETTGANGIMWECSCSCGGTAKVPAKYLTLVENGTRSCGCISSERDFRISYQGFKQDPTEAKRRWYVYLAEVANVIDKIGITQSLKARARLGQYSCYWWSRRMCYAEAWAIEKVALKATEHYLPDEPYIGRGTGPSEQRTGWVLEEVIDLLNTLVEECQRDGWQLFYERHFSHIKAEAQVE
jgi:hypothetical protein